MKPPVIINIALAGDHALNLHALASLLGQQKNFQVVSISKDLNRLSSSITEKDQHPHIVLLDINFDLYLPAGIIAYLKASHPDIRIVAVGLTKDRAAILRLHQMGVDCYLPKNSDPEKLENVLRQIAGNKKNAPPKPTAVTEEWPSVTPTERRYFRLAMSETSHQEIRRILKLPESTFTRLITALYRRFGVSSRDGLVVALYRTRFMIMDDI